MIRNYQYGEKLPEIRNYQYVEKLLVWGETISMWRNYQNGEKLLVWGESISIIIIIIKKDWQCKAGRGRLTPYHSEDPSPTLPTYREKEDKGKIVEDKKGDSNYRPTKRHWTCS